MKPVIKGTPSGGECIVMDVLPSCTKNTSNTESNSGDWRHSPCSACCTSLLTRTGSLLRARLSQGYSPDFRCRTADRGRDADQDCSRPFPLRGLNQRAERKPRRSCSAELHSYDKRGNSDIYRLGRNIWELINSFHFSISLIKANM